MIRLLPALLAVLLAGPASAELVEGVAAIVDDEVILLSEVQQAVDLVTTRMAIPDQRMPPELLRAVRSQALRSLIDDKLILQMASRMQLETSDEEVDSAIEKIAQEEGLSVDAVYQAAQQQGLDRRRYREALAGQLAKMRVLDVAVRGKISVSQEEVRAIYEERFGSVEPGQRVRLRHILLVWPSNEEPARQEVIELAASLRERAVDGEDFGVLAARYSQAPTAAEGGLTVFREGEVAPELAPYVFSLQPGEIGPPIETPHGVNLIQILERYDPSTVSFEQVRDRIATELYERKSRPEIERWLAEVREHHYIEIVAPELR